jgi:hypothetical protein
MNKVASMLIDLATIVRTSDNRTDILDRIDHLHRDASNVLLADRLMTEEEKIAYFTLMAKDLREIVQSRCEHEQRS